MIDISEVLNLPLETNSQRKAKEDRLKCVLEGNLKLYDPKADNVKRFLRLLSTKINRHLASSMVGCIHCGM